jgi:drug/metabolite transporter (DMT)-like permease
MNFISLLPVLYGLGAAIAWGVGDFAGGLAARRSNALAVVFNAEWVGLVGVVIIAVTLGEPAMTTSAWLIAMLAGIFGSFGLIVLYKSMADGQMSIAAPISALLAASLPVAVGSFSQGLPGPATLLGFFLALVAVWFISAGEGGQLGLKIEDWKVLRLPFLSGIGFGLYFILMHQAGQDSTLWPLAASRSGGLALMLSYALFKRPSLRLARPVWPIVAVNATLDVSANGFYVLASQVGRLDVASVLGSLYPGLTVLLAWLILKERIHLWQWLGIGLALAAIGLIAL